MNKIYVLLLFLSDFTFAQADKDSLLAKDADILIEELRFIHGLDQGTRKYLITAVSIKASLIALKG